MITLLELGYNQFLLVQLIVYMILKVHTFKTYYSFIKVGEDSVLTTFLYEIIIFRQ